MATDRDVLYDESIPGQDKFMDIVDEAMHPIMVSNPKLIDVSYIQDRGMQAVVALAASCEWNVVSKPGRVTTLIARTGFRCTIPTDTSIKFNVFANRVNAVVTHSLTHRPTLDLMERLIKQHKLDPSHARVS